MSRITPLLSMFTAAALSTAPSFGQWSVESLSQARGEICAVSVDGLALFGGGRSGPTLFDVVDVFDPSTGAWTTARLSVPRTSVIAASVGGYALFAGGATGIGIGSRVVDVYDSATSTWSMVMLSEPRVGHAATTIGSKVFFAGGAHAGTPSATIDVYDASIGAPDDPLAWSILQLSRARLNLAAVSTGSLAIFAGGHDFASAAADVDIYDNNTGLWFTATLSEARALGSTAAVAVGTRVYFAGGQLPPPGLTMSDVVDVYDTQTGSWSTATLSVPRGRVCATAIGNTALFAGGALDGFVPTDAIDTLDVGTGLWHTSWSLSEARFDAGVTSVDGMALFAAGAGNMGAASAAVDVYEPIGVKYCVADANSTGLAAAISSTGSNNVVDNDLTLHGTSLPANAFGYFLTSQTQGLVAQPGGSQGYLCLGGPIGRYVGPGQVQNSGAGGEISLALDLASTPTPTGLVTVQAGESWSFQCWYRDIGTTSNFTDAIGVTFR